MNFVEVSSPRVMDFVGQHHLMAAVAVVVVLSAGRLFNNVMVIRVGNLNPHHHPIPLSLQIKEEDLSNNIMALWVLNFGFQLLTYINFHIRVRLASAS